MGRGLGGSGLGVEFARIEYSKRWDACVDGTEPGVVGSRCSPEHGGLEGSQQHGDLRGAHWYFWKSLGCHWVEDGWCGWAGGAFEGGGTLLGAPGPTSLLPPYPLACPGGASHPCSDHGVCMDGMSGNGQCWCHPGFAGTACELCAPGAFGPHCQGEPSCPTQPCPDSLGPRANSILQFVPFCSLSLHLSWPL